MDGQGSHCELERRLVTPSLPMLLAHTSDEPSIGPSAPTGLQQPALLPVMRFYSLHMTGSSEGRVQLTLSMARAMHLAWLVGDLPSGIRAGCPAHAIEGPCSTARQHMFKIHCIRVRGHYLQTCSRWLLLVLPPLHQQPSSPHLPS